LVAAATGEVVSRRTGGGASTPPRAVSRTTSCLDEAAAFALIRSYLALLPSSARAARHLRPGR
jgi:acetyl-CoA carboxylase carboxyltransferase component